MSIISASSTYMDRYLFILALIPTGASAFYKGAVPHQHQEGPTIPAAAEGLLDNPAVLSDPNINPARKCGFCFGTNCPVSGL
ncbi:hypothetical protein QTG54_010535 [Skeletonema marinoi]|uniref:Uncharacterized protein n=1 Tax=Skeletonema marinoi TaxID=267567 RepID=A0AAD8Y3L5_9STRA|nr:hypothetical protein QTG54_010535 [Skeletonema marinoi]